MYLSDVFKFTQGLGQKGHQIGRKVGDAIELLTLGVIHLDDKLSEYLEIEDGVEGATSAKHKVEFSFYNLNDTGTPSKISEELFGIIECKKVGVEQTIKQSFKQWLSQNKNTPFHATNGFIFTISPSGFDLKWTIKIEAIGGGKSNIRFLINEFIGGRLLNSDVKEFYCGSGEQAIVAVDTLNNLFIIGPNDKLSQVPGHVSKCIVVEVKEVDQKGIIKINVNESLPGPQTPEKAKQASFVSLDVRKKVLGHFDKSNDDSFISILIIGEASHWEDKSRSMIKLCNDYNLIIPDSVLVHLFLKFEEKFGIGYQDMITKSNYKNSNEVRSSIFEIIQHFDTKILCDMKTGDFVKFTHAEENKKNKLKVINV